MKTWELMLEGSKLGPQIFGFLWSSETNGTCAAGAAMLGAGMDMERAAKLAVRAEALQYEANTLLTGSKKSQMTLDKLKELLV